MARNISSDETKVFFDWLEDEHEIFFCTVDGDEIDKEKIVKLWDEFVDGD